MLQTVFNTKSIYSKEKPILAGTLKALFVMKYTSASLWAIIKLNHLKNSTSHETATYTMASNVFLTFSLQNVGSIKHRTHNLIHLRNKHIEALLHKVTFISHKRCPFFPAKTFISSEILYSIAYHVN
jgi:hypothetical protein